MSSLMSRISGLVFGAVAISALPSIAAGCDLTFVQSAQSSSLTATEVGPSVAVEKDELIQLRNNDINNCQAYLRFSRLSSTSLDPAISFSLSSNGREIEVLPTEISAGTLASDLFIGSIPGAGTNDVSVPFRIEAPINWGIKSGSTNESLLIQIIDEQGQVGDSLTFTINLEVLPSADLRIVGATGTDRIAKIDLGVLEPRSVNSSDPFGIRVLSTSPYEVTFVSENAGMLVHNMANDRIAYDMRAGGRLVELTGGAPAIFGQHTTSLGDLHTLEITVPPFTALAGSYSDRVQITVTAS